MRELYDYLENWQNTNQKRLISLSIQQERGNLCCIALIDADDMSRHSFPKTRYEADMERFRRKALKHIGVGVLFESSSIPPRKVLAIQSKLQKCTTSIEIKQVFAEEFDLSDSQFTEDE
jgi:hypothetical protein